MLCIPILISMAQRSQRHPNTCADLKNPREVGMREELASPQAQGFQRIVLVTAMDTCPKFLLVLPAVWWWECVSPELEKPVCGGQCHGAGKSLGGVGILGIPVWTLGSLHWDSAISSPKAGPGGAGGQAHGLPSSPSSPLRRRIHTSVWRDFANIQFSLQPSAEFHSSPGPKCFPQRDSFRK